MSTPEAPRSIHDNPDKKGLAYKSKLMQNFIGLLVIVFIFKWLGSIGTPFDRTQIYRVEAGQPDYTFIPVQRERPIKLGAEFTDDASKWTVDNTLKQVKVRFLYSDGTAEEEESLITAAYKTFKNDTGGNQEGGFLVRMDRGPIKHARVLAKKLK